MALAETVSIKRACDSCYIRKIQCDSKKPRCDWCEHHGSACTFDRPVRGKRRLQSKKKHNGLPSATERLMESLTFSVTPNGLQPPSMSAQLPAIDATGLPPNEWSDPYSSSIQIRPSANFSPESPAKFHFAGLNLGQVSSYIGIPLFSYQGLDWISKQTGQYARFPHLDAPLWQSQFPAAGEIFPSSLDLNLPDESITWEYFSVFCSSPIHSVFPIVDPMVFRQTIKAAYWPQSSESPAESAKAKSCIFSFLALASFLEGNVEMPPIDSTLCAMKAQYLFPLIFLDTSLTSLQFAFMQCMFHLFSGQHQTAAKFHSLACRILFEFEAHLHPNDFDSEKPAGETNYSWRVKCHLRQYFWMCYSFDKDICLRTGQPPIINDAHCNLTLPRGYRDGNNKMLITNEAGTSFTPGDLQISLIKSKAIKSLYSTEALNKSDVELLRDIRELDDELESWRLSLHSEFRPKLLSAQDSAPAPRGNGPQRMHYIITNFEYHYLLATIHQATSRLRVWEGGDAETEAITSSMAISVEASRSTLIYLRAAAQTMLGESYWMAVFYPMSAVLTLFCNILLNPIDPRAQDDIVVLRSAPELIKGIRIRHLTLNETMHIKMIEEFAAELARLAQYATEKAYRNQILGM